MADALARHDAILNDAIGSAAGTVVKTTGDGMMAVFPTAADAVDAAIAAQRALADASWGETGPLRVRMASTRVTRNGAATTTSARRSTAPLGSWPSVTAARSCSRPRPRRSVPNASRRARACATSASTGSGTSAVRSGSSSWSTPTSSRVPAADHLRQRREPAHPDLGVRRPAGRARGGRAPPGGPVDPPPDPDRPGRHGQDEPRHPGRRRPDGPVPRRRVVRGPVARPRRGRADPGASVARSGWGRRPIALDPRRSWPTACASGRSCSCSTTSSR